MNALRTVNLFTLPAVLSVAACERPTGPELLAKMDKAYIDLASDTTGERVLSWGFAGSWGLIRLLPNGEVDKNLVANVDGGDHRFKAFVFERVVVRQDPHDGYPCPLTMRSLLAIEPGRQAFSLDGSDFSERVTDHPWCVVNLYNTGKHGASPSVWLDRLGGGRVGAVSGTARIDDAGKTADCTFLKLSNDFPFKVDCELRDYTVQLAVRLDLSREDTAQVRLKSPRWLSVSTQRLPGLRLILHCNEKNTEIGGCEAPSTFWRHPSPQDH